MEWLMFVLLGSSEGFIGWQVTNSEVTSSSQAMRSFRPIFQLHVVVIMVATLGLISFGCVQGFWPAAIFGTVVGHLLGTGILNNLFKLMPIVSKSDILRIVAATILFIYSAIQIIDT
jgi:hypothetical protein